MDAETTLTMSPLARESQVARDREAADAVGAETARLVGLAKAGSEQAFELLIRTYERRVLKVAYQLVSNHEDARDVAQEVFIRLFKYLDRIRENHKFSTWIYRLTVNASYDLLARRMSRLDSVSMEGSDGRTLDVADEATLSLTAQAEASDLKAKILGALDQLTPSERTVFVLRDLEGLESNEVASIQEISSITVRRHLSAARRKMRAVLAALHPGYARFDGGETGRKVEDHRSNADQNAVQGEPGC